MEIRDLTPEQEALSDRLADRLSEIFRDELKRLTQLMSSVPDAELLGQTEFEVRDRVHQLGARVIETALNERKKGGT